MQNETPMLDPVKAYSTALAMWLDTARTMQAQWLQSVSSMTSSTATEIDWKTIKIPVVNYTAAPSEAKMREAFQIAADINLNAWTQAANLLAALPRWAHWPTEIPGRVATDMFHEMRNGNKPETIYEKGAQSAAAAAPPARKPVMAATRLSQPLGDPDDLTLIKGIGPKLSARLNELGIFHLAQIAKLSVDDVEDLDDDIDGNGRIERDDWVGQARAKLANGQLS